MNQWAIKTIRLAKKKNYLDRLYKVYPNDPKPREVDTELLTSIEQSFKSENCEDLLVKLLDLDKFPFKDSYISFLRSDRTAIKRNPQTVKRICDTLFNMGFDKVKEGIVAPKEANTSRGPQFTNWAKDNFKLLGLESFSKSTRLGEL